MKKSIAAALAVTFVAAQPVFAASILGDASLYARDAVILSGSGNYGTVAADSISVSGSASYIDAGLSAAEVAAALDDAADLSAYFAGLATTSFSISGNSKVLTGVAGVNVINLTGSELASLNTFNATGATQLILNISGDLTKTGSTILFPGLAAEDVLFNFYDGGNVSLSGSGSLFGTVLAASSHVQMSGGSSVGGSVYADSFQGTGGGDKIGAAYFAGFVGLGDSTIPEPASWALMILGFGLVGSQLRRRRQGVVASVA